MSSLLHRHEPNVTENRHLYVGGSDVPTILGINSYKTQYELAREKVGITKSDFKGNEYTAFGHAMEPQIREYINLTTDYEFVETSTIDEENSIRANTDGVDHEYKTLLEIKTHGASLTNQMLNVYKAQMQIYMFVNDLEQGVLALYERPKDFNLEFDADLLNTDIIVKRDDDEIHHILSEIELFWKRCEWLKANPGASEWDYNTCISEHRIKGGSKPVSKALQVKTVKFEPAVVEFNFEEIEEQLEQQLKKYENLVFTEKESTECRNTIAELRKVKNFINRYRIDTKKKLTEPITKFEDKCKELVESIDGVIDPLSEQMNEFDEKQREEKRKRVEEIKQQVIEDLNLADEVAHELIIEDRFLNKSTTLKSIEENLHEQASDLILQKQNEQQNIELIKAHVEIVNLRNDIKLHESSYLNLAAHNSIEYIKEIIEDDAKAELTYQEEQEKEKRLAGAKKMKASFDKEQEEKTSQADEHSVEQFVEFYEITGTDEQLDQLEDYMNQLNIKWKVIEEDV